MKKKYFLWSILPLVAVVMFSICLMSCSSDDDDNDDYVSVPSDLIGTWHKTSGADKYNLTFTFNSDGTGIGDKSHKKIYSLATYSYTYKYKSNGDVVCDYTCVTVDEDGEQKGQGTMIFNYSDGKLTFTKAPNSSWVGCEFSKD